MASRHSAARPRRAGEDFARVHHGQDDSDDKRVKFDVRNPSILAPDEREDDAVLDADVIGGGNSTKRGAVNLDGYDSDSDNETFNARAQTRRKTGKVDILQQLDNYDAKGESLNGKGADPDDDDDDDMFAENDDKDDRDDGVENEDFDKAGKKKKKVGFLDNDQILGQERTSKAGGTVRMNDEESSDDEADVELAKAEEDLDEEVGAGGLKRNAPKLEAFNLKDEMEEGQFDQSGNFVRKSGDPDAVHDNWLDGMGKNAMKQAAAAHEKREAEARNRRIQEDEVLIPDLLRELIVRLDKAETPLEALARLGRGTTKTKKVPKWKLKKMNKDMDVDQAEAEEDPEQQRIKQAIDAITDAADKLLSRDHEQIYEQEREMLVRFWQRETGDQWTEPQAESGSTDAAGGASGTMWEFRWVDGRDGGVSQGPFDGPTMKAWKDAGYFGEGVEFRRVEPGQEWTQIVPSW